MASALDDPPIAVDTSVSLGLGSLYERAERAGSALQRTLTDSVVSYSDAKLVSKVTDQLRADVLEERARCRSLVDERDALSGAAKQLLQQLARRSEETATANERWQQTLGEWADERAFLLRRVEQLAENELFGRNRALFQLLNEKEALVVRLRERCDVATAEVGELRRQLHELREEETDPDGVDVDGIAMRGSVDAHALRAARQEVLRLKSVVARLEADGGHARVNQRR